MAVHGVKIDWDDDEFFFISPDGEDYLEVSRFPDALDGVEEELRAKLRGEKHSDGSQTMPGKAITYYNPLNR